MNDPNDPPAYSKEDPAKLEHPENVSSTGPVHPSAFRRPQKVSSDTVFTVFLESPEVGIVENRSAADVLKAHPNVVWKAFPTFAAALKCYTSAFNAKTIKIIEPIVFPVGRGTIINPIMVSPVRPLHTTPIPTTGSTPRRVLAPFPTMPPLTPPVTTSSNKRKEPDTMQQGTAAESSSAGKRARLAPTAAPSTSPSLTKLLFDKLQEVLAIVSERTGPVAEERLVDAVIARFDERLKTALGPIIDEAISAMESRLVGVLESAIHSSSVNPGTPVNSATGDEDMQL